MILTGLQLLGDGFGCFLSCRLFGLLAAAGFFDPTTTSGLPPTVGGGLAGAGAVVP